MNPGSGGTLARVLIVVLLVRLAIAVLLPFTGDEAYYYFWGLHPALAYYDHPPMVGWLLAPWVSIGMAPWWLRLPALLALIPVAWTVRALAWDAGEQKANLAAICVLLAPVDAFNVLTTTDTPLVVFSLCSLLSYHKGVRQVVAGGAAINRWHALAGLLLGAAFLSKYFAVLLGLSFVVFALTSPRRDRVMPGFLIVLACALPWGLFNAWANYEHCWLNILFNFESRHDNVRLSPASLGLYLASVVYLTSPVVLWQFARLVLRRQLPNAAGQAPAAPAGVSGDATLAASGGGANGSRTLWATAPRRLVLLAFVVPLLCFLLVALVRRVGLHWPLAFAPLAFVLAAYVLSTQALRSNARFLAVFSGAHLLAFALIGALPIETWRNLNIYDGLVLTDKPDEVLDALQGWRGRYVFATDGYSNSVTLSYQARRRAPGPVADAGELDFLVFGGGSAHGRQQDQYDDFRTLAGRDILIVRKTAPATDEYEPYFEQIERAQFDVRSVRFHVVLGHRFDYARYQAQVLTQIRDKFYQLPAWLPAGRCFFCERYFSAPTATIQ